LLSKGSGSSHVNALAAYIHQETGFSVPYNVSHYDLESLYVAVPFDILLNLITVVWRYLNDKAKEYQTGGRLVAVRAQLWLDFVRRAMKEENLRYTVDSECGVHYSIDEEFERNRLSALRCLESKRYAGARDAFDAAFRHFDANPPDTKAAVRSIFEAVEIVAKMMTSAPRLNRQLVEKELTALAVKCATDSTAVETVKELFAGFALWVNAAHNYRHGQGKQEPIAPPIEVAVYMLSSGTAFLRWLVAIDQKIAPAA
jgi:hypothetical protein